MSSRVLGSGNFSADGSVNIPTISAVSNKFLLILSGNFDSGTIVINANATLNTRVGITDPATGAAITLDPMAVAGAYPLEVSSEGIELALNGSGTPDLDWILYVASKGN